MTKRSLWFLLLVCGSIPLLHLKARAADFFTCYEGCGTAALSTSTECMSGTDYTVTLADRGAAVSVVSIHGGRIEAFTSEISSAMANQYRWNRYDFTAHGTPSCRNGSTDFEKLHITAARFNDSRAVALLARSPKAVAIHGYADSRKYGRGVMCVGGLDAVARAAFMSHIAENSSAWTGYPLVPMDATAAGSGDICGDLRGIDPDNIVNRTSSLGGLQLELNRGFREDLVNKAGSFDALRSLFFAAVYHAMTAAR